MSEKKFITRTPQRKRLTQTQRRCRKSLNEQIGLSDTNGGRMAEAALRWLDSQVADEWDKMDAIERLDQLVARRIRELVVAQHE